MKAASAKAKGRTFQQSIRDKLCAVFKGYLVAEDIRSTSMGVAGEDIQLSPRARECLPIQIECKAWAAKRLPVYEFYEQAEKHGKHQPVVFVKNNRKKPLAIVDADYLIHLLKESHDHGLT